MRSNSIERKQQEERGENKIWRDILYHDVKNE